MLSFLRVHQGIRYWRQIKRLSAESGGCTARRLLVDVSVLRRVDSRTGIQRVVRAILLELSRISLAGRVVQPVFATRKDAYHYCDLAFLGQDLSISVPRTEGLVVPRGGDVFLGLDLAIHLLPIHEWQIRHWKREGVVLFAVVYDLLPLRDRRWFTAKVRRRFRSWLKLLARRMDGTICISRAVAIEVQEAFAALGYKKGRPHISAIMLGGDILATLPSAGLPAGAEAIIELVRSRATILMVGTIEPRKAHDKALAAFEYLWAQRGETAPLLLIIGKAGWKTQALQQRLRTHPQAGTGFLWLDDVSDEFLDRLYGAAAGVLMTSYAEGCGLPVLEALANGRPVLVRDLPVFREIEAPSISFFQDDAPDALAASIIDFTHSSRQVGVEKSTVQAMTWANTALLLMNVIEAELANA